MQSFTIADRTYTYRSRRTYSGTVTTVTRDDGAKAQHLGFTRNLREAIPTLTFIAPRKVNAMPRGECQLCCHEQAIKSNGRMHRHGYRRPGWGFIVGGCPGQHRKPFPHTDALEEVRPQMERHAEYSERMADEATQVFVTVATRYDSHTRKTVRQQLEANSAEEYAAALAQVPAMYATWNPKTYDEAVERVRREHRGEAARARRELAWIDERIAKGRALRGAQ